MEKPIQWDRLQIGASAPLTIIAGPCVIEDADTTLQIAAFLKKLSQELELQLVFKASFDKANRTSIHSFRGPGMEKGLEILARVKSELDLMVLSDVHESSQIAQASNIIDIIQIPAFLCRQTDFLLAAARSSKPINIKKGQFLAPWDMANIVEKIRSTGNQKIMLTERGASFGYNNLVVDFRGIQIMQSTGCPVIFDATHSVQLPGGDGTHSGGQREFAPLLARAAVAAGADGVFLEVHPDPDRALCDGPNSLPLDQLQGLFLQLIAIRQAIESGEKL
jgi:2-dehydro-3-deoxyphosphooctonate aldolase (KDO 8-P synthase)